MNHDHNHQQLPAHSHDHNDFDPGIMYKEAWVQDLVNKIQLFLQANLSWLGLEDSKKQRILDYACGHGTISLALAKALPESTFQGLDSHPKQVERYNNEARNLLGDQHSRMYAIEGDLINPSSALEGKDWFGFDAIIISMALHHVPDPVDMLSKLRERLRSGGTLIVVEFYQPHSDSEDVETDVGIDKANMVEVVGGQRIWPGFTPQGLESMLSVAEFNDVDVKLLGETIRVPSHLAGDLAGAEMQVMFVKATAC